MKNIFVELECYMDAYTAFRQKRCDEAFTIIRQAIANDLYFTLLC